MIQDTKPEQTEESEQIANLSPEEEKELETVVKPEVVRQGKTNLEKFVKIPLQKLFESAKKHKRHFMIALAIGEAARAMGGGVAQASEAKPQPPSPGKKGAPSAQVEKIQLEKLGEVEIDQEVITPEQEDVVQPSEDVVQSSEEATSPVQAPQLTEQQQWDLLQQQKQQRANLQPEDFQRDVREIGQEGELGEEMASLQAGERSRAQLQREIAQGKRDAYGNPIE